MVDATAIPEHYQAQAEAVRAHLVHLRGGAPFLSPADALCLVGWLDAQVSVRAILAALDRAVASRRRTQARRPLTLTAAARHLGKPPLTPGGFAPAGEHPLEPVHDALAALDDPQAAQLAGQLRALPAADADAWVPAAVALCRDHFEVRWAGLSTAEREQRIAQAAAGLGDLANLVDPDTLHELAEEVAREAFRRAPGQVPWPRLDTATFESLAGPPR